MVSGELNMKEHGDTVRPPEERLDPEVAAMRRAFDAIRTRIIGGLLLILPVLITFYILASLYQGFRDYLIDPVAGLVVVAVKGPQITEELPQWFRLYVAPVIAAAIIVALLYFVGLFVRSRLHRMFDWVLLHVPVVTTVYRSVRNVFNALDTPTGFSRFKRVVLVAFPHPGMRVPGFVTSSCRDAHTGKSILCVYVPTTPIPTSGYMLMVPEEDVTELDWTIDETLQAIISGGISVPRHVRYHIPAGR
jgi:uncharacterized membrane protein